MKHNFFLKSFVLFGLMSVCGNSSALETKKPIAVYNTTDKKLIFYYDATDHRTEGEVYTFNGTDFETDVRASGSIDWATCKDSVTTAVFNSSFEDYYPVSTEYMFKGCKLLEKITGLEYLNTSSVTNMNGMFKYCYAITSLDLSKFDTSKVTDMQCMFQGCWVLNPLDLSSFDTSNVTTMANMFYNCQTITNLDLSSFNTSNVTTMASMFCNCQTITNLDLSKFDTSKVTDMQCMFQGCMVLNPLDLSSFDTSNVTTMANMFCNCQTITNLDLSSFNTSKVTGMQCMFQGCWVLNPLDLSSFDTSNVTTMANMFYNCQTITNLDLSSFNTSNVTTMAAMFYNCQAITNLDLSNFNTSNVTDMQSMFNNCTELTTINVDASMWSTSMVTSSADMFASCSKLVGENGKKCFGKNYIDKTYARIDGGTSAPGYLSGFTNLSVSAAGYATFYDSKHAYTIPSGLTGYIFSKGVKKIKETYTVGSVVPAGEALVVGGEMKGYKLLYTWTSDATRSSDNVLLGTDTETAIENDASCYFYGLALGTSEAHKGKIGFYWRAADGAAFTNGAHRAYLKLDKGAGVKSGFAFDEVTAVDDMVVGMGDRASVFNLSGQVVGDGYKGLVIRNGKKYFNK